MEPSWVMNGPDEVSYSGEVEIEVTTKVTVTIRNGDVVGVSEFKLSADDEAYAIEKFTEESDADGLSGD